MLRQIVIAAIAAIVTMSVFSPTHTSINLATTPECVTREVNASNGEWISAIAGDNDTGERTYYIAPAKWPHTSSRPWKIVTVTNFLFLENCETEEKHL